MSLEKSLKMSFIDGIFASIMFGLTVNYITPFALLLGAKNFHIGMLTSIPQLFGALVQLKSAEISEFIKSRVKTITLFVTLQALTWFIVYITILNKENFNVEIFIFIITLNTVFGSLALPPWASLMSDTVDKSKYGEYFSWRGKVLGFINLGVSFLAGYFLYLMKDKLLGFIIIFILAGVCRLISAYYLGQMIDVPVKEVDERKFSYWEFIVRVKESNFVKFILFVSMLNFATFVAAPFFSVYMLKELKMSYSEYTIINTFTALSGLVFLPFWGKFADRFGNVKIVKIVGRLIVLLPLLWIFSKNFFYLIIINIFAGYLWAGFNLAAGNFIFDAVSRDIRTRCVAYFNFTNGLLIFLGSILGGWLATYVPGIISGSPLLTLFFISFVLRLLAVLLLIDKFDEVREVEEIEDTRLFHIVLGVERVRILYEEIFFKMKKIAKKVNNI